MKKYRVEAFIVPSIAKNEMELNQIDDVKLAKKLKNKSLNSSKESEDQISTDKSVFNNSENKHNEVENNNHNLSEFSGIFFEINEHIYDEIIVPENKNEKEIEKKNINSEYTKAFLKIEEPLYDEPFVGNLININSNSNNSSNMYKNSWMLANSKYKKFGIVAPKLPKRSSSLKSIVEDNESFNDTLQDVCSHGRKNGCLVNNQRPEDISEEIFKENWMKRLDALRKLETLLKDKEIALQSRERLLLKKERELRILERLIKDKMKQIELYAKRYKKSLSSENIMSNGTNFEFKTSDDLKIYSKSDVMSSSSTCILKTNSNILLDNKDELDLGIQHIKNSFTTDRFSNRIDNLKVKSKPYPKLKYDDLDSTLSADVGDSSFIVTSKKFDPESFKKPAAFIRSASERRPKIEQLSSLRINTLSERNSHVEGIVDLLEEKTLKRISDNILASQDQETKFLNYGLIDNKSLDNTKFFNKKEKPNEKHFSYLNLENSNKTKSKNVSKERPVSWNEDADDWLQRKRQAYILATKKAENIAEKENFVKQTKTNNSIKIIKKKENNRKKFSIFR